MLLGSGLLLVLTAEDACDRRHGHELEVRDEHCDRGCMHVREGVCERMFGVVACVICVVVWVVGCVVECV